MSTPAVSTKEDFCQELREFAPPALWVGASTATLGTVTAYVITGASAAAAGALFGSAAAITFSTTLLVNIIVGQFFAQGSYIRKVLVDTIAIISILSAPIGGWAACAAAGFALTALEITALTVATYAGGILGFYLDSLFSSQN